MQRLREFLLLCFLPVLLLLTAAFPATVHAQAQTPKTVLEQLFTSETIDEAWFSDAFLAQVAPAQIAAILDQLRTELGDFARIEGEASPFTVIFAKGQLTTEITLDGDGKIIGLFFHPPTPAVDSLEAAIDHFMALPGDVSVLVRRDDELLTGLNPNEPVAVGSAFKLAILAALQAQIEAGEHSWDEVVMLDPAWKSLPSGILQTWPDSSPLTLHTLATLMITLSDNTAADALLQIVGREAVEAYAERNQPFLTTQEAFKLKAQSNADLLTRYRAGDEAEKRQVLDELADVPLPALADFPSEPTLAVEWYFTAAELCDLMAQVQALDLMSVNPGPGIADPAAWARVAFKGGSEPGVLNLTYWLTSADQQEYCVAVTQNRTNAAIDEVQFAGLTRALIGTLAAITPTTPSVDLLDTQWQLLSFGSVDDQTPVVAGSIITLTFTDDGRAGGYSGCNSYGGSYEVDGANLTIGSVVSTRRACADQAVMEQEQQYLQALALAQRFTLEDDQLQIFYDEGQRVLTFTPVTTEPPQTAAPGCYYPGENKLWLLAPEEVRRLELPITVGLYFDCTTTTGRLLYASHFPNQGAGPGNISVTDLWLFDLATEEATSIFAEDEIVEALWAPDGEQLAYIRATDESYELRWRTRATADEAEDRLLAEDVAFTFSVAPDGEQVAFTRESGYGLDVQPGLYVVDVATGTEERIADVDRAGQGGIDEKPVWSPTGETILLPVNVPAVGNRLLRAAVDGSGAVLLEFDPALADEQWYQFVPTNLIWATPTQFLGTAFITTSHGPMGGDPHVVRYQLNDDLDTIVDGAIVAEGMLLGWAVPGESVWVQMEDTLQRVDLAASNE